MLTPFRFASLFSCLFFCLTATLSAQNLALSTQNPDELYVCGIDQMTVTIQNGSGSPAATTLRVSIVFPAGVTYVTGSVSGATEFNIGNLNAPVFSLTDLAGGANATLSLNIQAGCALVDAINSGQQFSNNITATYAGGSKQLTSNSYIIETGLANLISVDPTTVNAMKGDVIMRTIKLRNTRLGPIQSLSFRDQHQSGITIDLQGGINQNNAATLFTGEIPGSYFTAFGDGDNLLESSDGEITIVEKVTVTSCGIPSFTTKSDIIVGWGCGNTTCRTDSINAQITILPSNQNPNLVFEPVYGAPVSFCGAVPAVQEILIINNGQLAANNVLVDVFTIDTSFQGLDAASFEWSNDGITWQTAGVLSSEPTVLSSCNNSDYKVDVVVTIPEVLPGDTVRLRFDSYSCHPSCTGFNPRMRFAFSYNKACPPNVATNGIKNFFPDSAFLSVRSEINFEIGHCLEDDTTYNLVYWIKSQRLLVDTGVVQVLIELPKGLVWDPTCGFNLDGQTPLESSVSVDPTTGLTSIRAVFDLPFTQDSVADEICIKYDCTNGMPCEATVPNVPPRGLSYLVYPPPSDCDGCQLKVRSYSTISLTPDDSPDCGVTVCDEFLMVVDDVCAGGTGGGGGGGGPAGGGAGGSTDLNVTFSFDSWRTNKGLLDANNDRQADNNSVASGPGVNLGRFLPGDTMRNEYRMAVQTGTLSGVNYRLFLETMASDFEKPFGEFTGDAYDMVLGIPNVLFTNYDTTSFVGGRIIIKKAGGQTFNCPINVPTVRSDQHMIQVAEPNIRPEVIVDVVANMFDQYNFSVADQIAAGCLPNGFTISAGDSLFFQMDYKFKSNFVPPAGATPPLINFRTSVCDQFKTYSWELEDFCTNKPLRQFSGYTEQITPAAQIIEPCNESTEVTPFYYGIRIARENLFPFEVRPLASVLSYSYSLPTSVELVSTKLNFLNLQENTPLFTNENLTPGFEGDSLQLDLGPYFENPLDEGFSFEISTRFDTICGYNGTKFGRTNLGLQYANECFHDPVVTEYFISNPNGYQSGSPQIDFFNIGTNVVTIPTNDVTLNFTLRNSSPVTAYNAWLVIESDNNLYDVQLFTIDPPNLIPVPVVGGVYQLDSLIPFEQPFFRLFAKSRSCGPFDVTYRFGWSCSPVYNPDAETCGEFSGTVEVRPQSPELELSIIKEQDMVPLCAPSADFEFEISNANDGSAYNVVPTVKLPQGFSIVPGSSRLSFPAGSAPITMPNPVQLPGNVWRFDPQAISPQLVQNGLVSFEQEPLNAMRILFKVQAECGAVANAQPVYGAEAVQPCGISSNVLRKPGEPIGINGVVPTTSAVANLNFSTPPGTVGCGQTVELSASIALDGTPMSGDSIYITLPAGTTYVSGSYTAGANAPAGPPQVFGQLLQLPLPNNLGSNAVLTFTFNVRYDDPAGCADKIVALQTREKTQAVCGATACDVYVATSEALLNLNAQNPELQLVNFQVQNQSNGQSTFTASLENAGTAAATNPVVELYHDQNGNGVIDPTDPLVATVNHNGVVNPGAIIGLSGNIDLSAAAFCDLIALIPADENCACSDKVFPLGGNQIITEGVGLCAVGPVTVGTENVQGNTYTWLTPGGLSCTNCASAVFTPGPDVQLGSMITLVLLETAGDCSIERRFDIEYIGSTTIDPVTQTICSGSTATLETTTGGIQYNWSGPGITDPSLQTQIVSPIGNTQYAVTVTFTGGCTGTGTVLVLVNSSTATTKSLSTCEGEPIEVFDDLTTDQAGVYSRTYPAFNGCDSVVTVTLVVPVSFTESSVTICQGDSIVIAGTVIKEPTVKCTDYASSSGCDSTHCVNVSVVDNPNVAPVDSVILQLGESITLNGPSGFNEYDWAPPGDLNCSDCEDPIANPDSTTTFVLVVKDGNGCKDSIDYRVFICDVDKYLKEIPNAFTPNGDNANDAFRPVPNEGAEMIVSLQVYNRWGTKVYEGFGKNAAWDGTQNAKPAPSDVYVWVIIAECSGVQKKKTGEITLLR